jgi:hypothetical protein
LAYSGRHDEIREQQGRVLNQRLVQVQRRLDRLTFASKSLPTRRADSMHLLNGRFCYQVILSSLPGVFMSAAR